MEKFESFPLAKWDAMNTHASTMVWYPTWFLNNLPSFTGIDKRLVLQSILLNGEVGSLIKEVCVLQEINDLPALPTRSVRRRFP